MRRDFDVLVVGGGMVGLTAACLLARDDALRVTLVDAGKRPAFDPAAGVSLRVSSVAPGSMEILAEIGAWEAILNTRACPFRDMKVWDSSGHHDGPETLSFESAEFAVPELGYIVENALIQHELLHTLASTEALIRFDTPIASVRRDGYRFAVELGDGETLVPDVLVAADGARSFIRGQAGIATRSWRHEQDAFVTLLETTRPHRFTAWQRFLDTGPIGMLPLSDGRISVVWSTSPEAAEAALAMTDDALSEKLTEVSGGVLGPLAVAGPRGRFPLVSLHADHYVEAGLALIGDAAHSIHPLAGQGANLGLADANELARVVRDAIDRGENPGDRPVLRQYERARKGENETMLQFMHLLNRLFSNDSPALSRLRGFGMFLFNRSGPIRERAVRTALGVRR